MTFVFHACTYAYNDANQLTSADGITTTWDQRGNLVHDGVFTYTYNAAGRLVQARAVGVGFKPTPTARGTCQFSPGIGPPLFGQLGPDIKMALVKLQGSKKMTIGLEKIRMSFVLFIFMLTCSCGFYVPLSNLTPGTRGNSRPDWSYDGNYIAFSSYTSFTSSNGSSSGYWQLYLIETNTLDTRRLTNRATNDDSVSFSPDGQTISFVSDRDGYRDIYLMDSETLQIDRLTDCGQEDTSCSYPTWSPDGQMIAFVKTGMYENDWGIYIVDIDGSNVTRLTPRTGSGIDWSPDGNFIAFSDEGICVLEIDNATSTCLTNNEDYNPVWSPDGQTIAFESQRGGNAEIYLIDVDGSNLTQVTDVRGESRYPTWAPGGDRIAFRIDSDVCVGIATINLDGTDLACLWDER